MHQEHIYHLTAVTNWPFIERHGLLSARSLLDLFDIYEQQVGIEQCHRSERVVLPNGIVIRDQKPMPPVALKRCLIGMTPVQWYMLLNSKVFFWLDVERLNRLRRVDKQLPQIVLVIEAKKLLRQYAELTTLTPINTGNARRQPACRGRQTFVPYNTWLESRWASEAEALGTRRSSSHKPVELTVADAVPDVMNFVFDVRWLREGEELMQ